MATYFWLSSNPKVIPTTCGWEDNMLSTLVDEVLIKITNILVIKCSNTPEVFECITYILGHDCRFSKDPLQRGESILNCVRENIKMFTGARSASHICLLDLHGLVLRTNMLVDFKKWNELYKLDDLRYLETILSMKK
jgi:hypothetical protein